MTQHTHDTTHDTALSPAQNRERTRHTQACPARGGTPTPSLHSTTEQKRKEGRKGGRKEGRKEEEKRSARGDALSNAFRLLDSYLESQQQFSKPSAP